MGASHISLTQRERQYLKVLADGDKARRTADRARILLLRADGMTIQDIALFDNLHPRTPCRDIPRRKGMAAGYCPAHTG